MPVPNGDRSRCLWHLETCSHAWKMPDVLQPQARGAMAIWFPLQRNSQKESQAWQGGLELADLPVAHGRLNFRFRDRPPVGPLSFSFTAVCHYDHYYYTSRSQLPWGDVRMLQMAACLVKVRYE